MEEIKLPENLTEDKAKSYFEFLSNRLEMIDNILKNKTKKTDVKHLKEIKKITDEKIKKLKELFPILNEEE